MDREIEGALGARWEALQALIHVVSLLGWVRLPPATGWLEIDSSFYINVYGC